MVWYPNGQIALCVFLVWTAIGFCLAAVHAQHRTSRGAPLVCGRLSRSAAFSVSGKLPPGVLSDAGGDTRWAAPSPGSVRTRGAVTQGGQLQAQGLGVRGGGDSVARLGQISRPIWQRWLQREEGSACPGSGSTRGAVPSSVISQSEDLDVQWICARCYQPICDWLVMISTQR